MGVRITLSPVSAFAALAVTAPFLLSEMVTPYFATLLPPPPPEEELEEDFLNTVTVQLAVSVLEGVLSPSVSVPSPVAVSPSA